jgi:hypothetical protein
METMTKKNYIADRETYLTLKEVQKAIALEIKTARKAYRQASSQWAKEVPRSMWAHPKLELTPEAFNARELNIIYGMLRGKTYKQIEPKVKEGNEPSLYVLEQIIAKYRLKESDFFEMTQVTPRLVQKVLKNG